MKRPNSTSSRGFTLSSRVTRASKGASIKRPPWVKRVKLSKEICAHESLTFVQDTSRTSMVVRTWTRCIGGAIERSRQRRWMRSWRRFRRRGGPLPSAINSPSVHVHGFRQRPPSSTLRRCLQCFQKLHTRIYRPKIAEVHLELRDAF